MGLLLLAVAACGSDPSNPFQPPAGGAPGTGGQGGEGGEGPTIDPTLGGPCVDDDQCNDELSCTFDFCDKEVDRCRFLPDDSSCQNGIYCDGQEVCDNKLGCRLDAPVGCSDNNVCTIDTCIEATQGCTNEPRDADLDGDPDNHCGGGDCNDLDPLVSSQTPEICSNQVDDNCDGAIDESGCVAPKNDTCLEPLEISAAGVYPLSTVGAAFDYPTSCGISAPGTRDVVAAVVLPAGPLVDVLVTAKSPAGEISVAITEQCGSPATEVACGASFVSASGGAIAKARGRSLGSTTEPTAYPVYIAQNPGAAATLSVSFLPPTPKPTNETCGLTSVLTPGVPVTIPLLDPIDDVASACVHATGDLVYEFTLDQAQDVDLYALSVDGDGVPSVSLREPSCSMVEDEIACQTADPGHIFRHSMPAGTYYVSVSATAPTDVSLTLEVSPPTPAPADEMCATAPVLPLNTAVDIDLNNHQDDHDLGCLGTGIDAAYSLSITAPSDVLVVQRHSVGDATAVMLSEEDCADASNLIACGTGNPSPTRATKHNLPPGDYRAITESTLGLPVQLTALVRPAKPPTLLPFSDDCTDAHTIPKTGGFFQGNTANATADFPAGCDAGGGQPNGAKEQLLKLTLDAPKRVVLDMNGSSYLTMLAVRQGTCPGTQVPAACAVGFAPQRSFLDLDLDAGDYFIQVDGYAGATGPWFLDVFVVDP